MIHYFWFQCMRVLLLVTLATSVPFIGAQESNLLPQDLKIHYAVFWDPVCWQLGSVFVIVGLTHNAIILFMLYPGGPICEYTPESFLSHYSLISRGRCSNLLYYQVLQISLDLVWSLPTIYPFLFSPRAQAEWHRGWPVSKLRFLSFSSCSHPSYFRNLCTA